MYIYNISIIYIYIFHVLDRVKVTPKIISISSRLLTERQIKLLRRGLNFTPTPKAYTTELKSDIQEFTCKLWLIEFFDLENLDNSQETRQSVSGSLVKNKSNFYPLRNRNKFLDTTIDFINQQNLNNLSKSKTNLSKDDWQASKELKNDNSIVIKEGDKEGAVVIMDSAHYEQMIYKQLEDKNTKKVDPSCDNKTMRTNDTLIKKYENSFLKHEIDYLTNFQHESSNFYGLPKIHKSKMISKVIKEQSWIYFMFPTKRLKTMPYSNRSQNSDLKSQQFCG